MGWQGLGSEKVRAWRGKAVGQGSSVPLRSEPGPANEAEECPIVRTHTYIKHTYIHHTDLVVQLHRPPRGGRQKLEVRSQMVRPSGARDGHGLRGEQPDLAVVREGCGQRVWTRSLAHHANTTCAMSARCFCAIRCSSGFWNTGLCSAGNLRPSHWVPKELYALPQTETQTDRQTETEIEICHIGNERK